MDSNGIISSLITSNRALCDALQGLLRGQHNYTERVTAPQESVSPISSHYLDDEADDKMARDIERDRVAMAREWEAQELQARGLEQMFAPKLEEVEPLSPGLETVVRGLTKHQGADPLSPGVVGRRDGDGDDLENS